MKITPQKIQGLTVRILKPNPQTASDWDGVWNVPFSPASRDHLDALAQERVFLVGASGRARHLTTAAQRTKSVGALLAEVA